MFIPLMFARQTEHRRKVAMWKMSSKLHTALVLAVAMAVVGCQTVPEREAGSSGVELSRSSGDVQIVDPDTRAHLQTELHLGDYVALAERVTNKMLSSDVVARWGKKKPRLIVGRLLNNTDNENIRMSDVHDRIQEVVFNSGLVRVVDKSATRFDYIIKSELSSSRQYAKDGRELVYYILQLKLFKLDGELMGQWSDRIALAKPKRKFF